MKIVCFVSGADPLHLSHVTGGAALTSPAQVREEKSLIEHDLFGKPLHTFPDHALDKRFHETGID
jgi:hypothetical protein